MTTAPAAANRWQAAAEAVRADTVRPWLQAARTEALGRFLETGFPTPRQEAWRRTDVRPIERTPFEAPPPPAAAPAGAPVVGPAREAARLVFVNGRLDTDRSSTDGLPPGVVVEDLLAAAGRVEDGLRRRLLALADGTGHPFAALNGALFDHGVLVRAAAGARLDAPVHLVFVAEGGARPAAVHPRVLVVAETGSEIQVLETWVGGSSSPWLTNAVTEIHVDDDARVQHAVVQQEREGTWHVGLVAARLGRNARLHAFGLTLGAALARQDVEVTLAGPGAELGLDGVYLVDGRRHVDVVTNVDHAAEHATSRQVYKGVLRDRATAAFAGRVLVRPGAQHTDARQASHHLLLSPDAVADSKPQLEIFADDVKCAHGATVGQLDEDAVFYLRSRGLPDDAARRVLVRAFAAEVPGRLPEGDLRTHLTALLERSLGGTA